ncbi:MAG: hypothetical protein ABSA93_23210 [Streptosporangiaceae bacterium]|jgi:hypothetical protein
MMGSAELSAKERAVLFALLAEARKLSNPELEDRIGFRLDGKERRKLEELKLVDRERPGRAFEFELSDAGWRWCANELSAGPASRASYLERTLYVILGGLDRYLDRSDQSLADIFRLVNGEPSETLDIPARVRAGYQALTQEPGEFVPLVELRASVGEIPRADLDSALDRMYRAQEINLIPESNQQTLTDADRESALRVGGENKHLISIERP